MSISRGTNTCTLLTTRVTGAATLFLHEFGVFLTLALRRPAHTVFRLVPTSWHTWRSNTSLHLSSSALHNLQSFPFVSPPSDPSFFFVQSILPLLTPFSLFLNLVSFYPSFSFPSHVSSPSFYSSFPLPPFSLPFFCLAFVSSALLSAAFPFLLLFYS